MTTPNAPPPIPSEAPKISKHLIHSITLQDMVNYLVKRPFEEVHELIAKVRQSIVPFVQDQVDPETKNPSTRPTNPTLK